MSIRNFNKPYNKEVNNFVNFVTNCRSKSQTSNYMYKVLSKYYNNIIQTEHYIIACGDAPFALYAHMDIIGDGSKVKPIVNYLQKDILFVSSDIINPCGFDDKAGLFIILQYVEKWGAKWLKSQHMLPTIFLTTEEEYGHESVTHLILDMRANLQILKNIKFIVGLDRANERDAVFYNCNNEEFINFIESTTGYRFARGTYTDIVIMSPAWDIASVNLSVGYAREHTPFEYLYWNQMQNTFNAVEFLAKASWKLTKKFEFVHHTNREEEFEKCELCGMGLDIFEGIMVDTSEKTTTVCPKCFCNNFKYSHPTVVLKSKGSFKNGDKG